MHLALTDVQRRALKAIGISIWEPAAPAPDPLGAQPVAAPPAKPPSIDADAWSRLAAEVAACTRCPLHASRTQTVFGVGNPAADWLVIGEAPGADEDRQGEPFVGRAGQLLNEMLRAAGTSRDRVYIANILKCRPPQNRDPQAEEIQACGDYLRRQIALLRPRLILAVGRIAAQSLLGTEQPVGRLRGRVHHYEPAAIPLVVTYHPAYLLRSPAEKRKAWDDLCLARAALREASA